MTAAPIRRVGRDWDYVTMADYEADMMESAEHVSSIIRHQAGKIRDFERLICALAASNGGQLTLDPRVLGHIDDYEFERWYSASDDRWMFKAKRKP